MSSLLYANKFLLNITKTHFKGFKAKHIEGQSTEKVENSHQKALKKQTSRFNQAALFMFSSFSKSMIYYFRVTSFNVMVVMWPVKIRSMIIMLYSSVANSPLFYYNLL